MDMKKHCASTLVAIWLMVGAVGGARAQGTPEANSATLEKLPRTFDFAAPRHGDTSLEYEGTFPGLPKKMMIYKVKDPNVTEAYVREVARKHFGIPADAELARSERMGLYWLRSGVRLFEVDPANGSFNIDKVREDRPETWVRKNYPSKVESRVIAEEYLKSRDLLQADAYFRGAADNISGSGVMSVGFGRLVGGHKNWGAGAQILVDIGPEGEVVGVRRAWQELIAYRPYPVKSPQEALEELQNGKGVLMHGSRGKVEEIAFRYYTSPDKQEYVQPIYYFDCNGPEGRFYGVVPAIKDEYLEAPEDTSTPTWMMCRNTECQAEYEIKLKEYVAAVEGFVKAHPNSPVAPSLVCEKCGKDSAYRAIKCEKCGLIFEAGWKGPDYYDRCPQCKFSKTEERKKPRKAKRKG